MGGSKKAKLRDLQTSVSRLREPSFSECPIGVQYPVLSWRSGGRAGGRAGGRGGQRGEGRAGGRAGGRLVER
jgi:hypothetical protein